MLLKRGVYVFDEGVRHTIVIPAFAGDCHGIGGAHGIEGLDPDFGLRIGKDAWILPDSFPQGRSDVLIRHAGVDIEGLLYPEDLLGAVVGDAAGGQDAVGDDDGDVVNGDERGIEVADSLDDPPRAAGIDDVAFTEGLGNRQDTAGKEIGQQALHREGQG